LKVPPWKPVTVRLGYAGGVAAASPGSRSDTPGTKGMDHQPWRGCRGVPSHHLRGAATPIDQTPGRRSRANPGLPAATPPAYRAGSCQKLGSQLPVCCRQFSVPCSCPEGATGESPGWNPGNHATQCPPCPQGARGTRDEGAPFAPLGRVPVGCGDPGFRSAPPGAVAVSCVAARADARNSRLPEISSPRQEGLES